MDIQRSTVEIENCLFYNNSGSYSFFESEQSLPFHAILTASQYKLNYIAHSKAESSNLSGTGQSGASQPIEVQRARGGEHCIDEFSSVGEDCFSASYDLSESTDKDSSNPLRGHSLHIQYPHMKGVIYIEQTNQTLITNCTFTKNDAGPLLDDFQIVGMIDNQNNYGNVQRASSVHIDKGVTKVEIRESLFHENYLDFMQNHISKNNMDLFNYFPPEYFNTSFSPIVNIHMNEASEEACEIAITNNTFKDQRNTQILGYEQLDVTFNDMKYYASLLSIKSKS